jgi:hypothetical protein
LKKNNFATVIFAGCLSFSLLTFFFSCEHFLEGGELKNQLGSEIKRANSNDHEIRIECSETFGSITTGAVVTKKVNDIFSIEYKANSDTYFLGWKAYTKTSDNTLTFLSADYIAFSDYETTSSDGLYSVTVKFLKEADNIYIKPVVFKVSPGAASTNYSNTPVIIQFSEQQDSSAAEIPISYIHAKNSLADCFDTPVFNSQKTVLTLTPKPSEIKNYITTNSLPYLDLQFYSEEIFHKKTFTVRYSPQEDSIPPVKYDFFVTRHQISLNNKYITSPHELEESQKFDSIVYSTYDENGYIYTEPESVSHFLQNRTNGTIYIYGEYYDEDSGIRSINVIEELVAAKTQGALEASNPVEHIYFAGSENIEFLQDYNGNTKFCIKCNLESDDGVVKIRVTTIDGGGNESVKQVFTATKCSNINLRKSIYLTNGSDFVSKYSNDNNNDDFDINSEDYKKELKTITIGNIWLGNYIYPILSLHECGDYFLNNSPDQILSMSCSIKEKGSTETKIIDNIPFLIPYQNAFGEWTVELDTEELAGMTFILTASDDMGNTDSIELQFPDPDDFTYVNTEAAGDETPRITSFYSTAKDYDFEGIAFIEKKDNPENETTKWNDYIRKYSLQPFLTLDDPDDKEYFIFPCFSNDFVQIYTGVSTKTYKFTAPPHIRTITENDFTVSKNIESRYLKIDFIMTDEAISEYETVYIENTIFNGFSPYVFDKETRTCTLLIDINDLYNPQDIKYNICGVKNSGITKFEYTIEHIDPSDTRYDKNPPVQITTNNNNDDTIKRTDWEHYRLTVVDDQSGPDKGIFKVSGSNVTYIADESSSYSIEIPIRNIEIEKWAESPTNYGAYFNYYFDYELYDKAGNYLKKKNHKEDIKFLPAISSISRNEDLWFLTSKEFDYLYNPEILSPRIIAELRKLDFEIYILNPDNTWSLYNIKKDIMFNLNWMGDTNIYTWTNAEGLELPDDKIIKIFTSASSLNNTIWSIPSYFYTGTQSTGKYDYIQSHTTKTVLIASDAPVFVHTVYVPKDYKECKNWTAEEWEYFHEHLGDTYMDFTATPTAQRYNIPFDKIEEGSYYCVIAHFANGTSALSEVMEK